MTTIDHDLRDRRDLERLLRAFYAKALEDEQIGYLFTEVAKLDLEAHLPVITDFWETVLFSIPRYKGSPLEPHAELHRLSPLTAAHFDRWLELWTQTVDAHAAGPVAELAKTRARSIAAVMQSQLQRPRGA